MSGPAFSAEYCFVGPPYFPLKLGVGILGGRRASPLRPIRAAPPEACISEGGMILLDTLVELKVINSSFSSSICLIRVVRAYLLIEIRRAVPRRAIRGNSISVNSTLLPHNPIHGVCLLGSQIPASCISGVWQLSVPFLRKGRRETHVVPQRRSKTLQR